MVSPGKSVPGVVYVSPVSELNAGLWTLFVGASIFLGLRIWCKCTLRRTGLWYDDYVLVLAWLVLLVTNTIISAEYATGYVGGWDDRMHILINISGCGTLVGQAWSKTALGITLLRMSNKTQAAILWFCIISMNIFMILKVFFTWARYCNESQYQDWYRFQSGCINYTAEERIKVGGNTYNIIMDFVFSLFPWWITWNLEMRKVEKIALCGTMSLGMLVAIISTIRTTYWVYRPIMHSHDEYYIWRNAMSNIWYSAEVAGTIIVQCIPILRPLLRDLHTTLTSKRINDTETGASRSAGRQSFFEGKHDLGYTSNVSTGKNGPEVIALSAIPEEPGVIRKESSYSMSSASENDEIVSTPTAPAGPLSRDSHSWRLSGSERTELHSPQSGTWTEVDQYDRNGLSPPPPPPLPK